MTRESAPRAVALCMIAAAARNGDPAPGNAEIAVACGYESTGSAVALIKRLERDGVIRVERFHMSRVITIVATGQRTRGHQGGRPHWCLRRAAAAQSKGGQQPMSKGATARLVARAEAGNHAAEADHRRQIRRLMQRGWTDAQVLARVGMPQLVDDERALMLVAQKRAAVERARERAIVESEPAAVARVLRAGVLPSPNARYRQGRRTLAAVGGMLV